MTRSRLDEGQVVQAAAELADREGFDAVTLARLAGQLGRHASSLYNHVDGLPGLRRKIALRGATGLADAVWTAAIGRSGPEAMTAIAHAYRQYARDHPGCYNALTVTRADDDEELAAAGARTPQAIQAVFRSFGLDDTAAVHAHRVFTATIRGFVLVETHRGYTPSPDPEETFEEVVRLFLSALGSGTWLADSAPDTSTDS